ncbi:pollen-specific leucine-rich repeat extensin-like protein 3 [Iris pallida]|uniref:Pollen-specific leucine-rich repeat extensin-like protein 3 n=1 Tax=Iris pallida TaxID=29817 RepID=A0AAX6F154_IRIPA|nr:pollen-specific leucine-rich repeat extensin-like protein 3 [Iris pallida]
MDGGDVEGADRGRRRCCRKGQTRLSISLSLLFWAVVYFWWRWFVGSWRILVVWCGAAGDGRGGGGLNGEVVVSRRDGRGDDDGGGIGRLGCRRWGHR